MQEVKTKNERAEGDKVIKKQPCDVIKINWDMGGEAQKKKDG